jgi:hypothetical protein
MSTVTFQKATGLPDTTGPSPRIWADCPVQAFLKDPALGIHYFDAFNDRSLVVDTSLEGYGLVGTNADLDWGTDGKTLLLETGGADNDSAGIFQRPCITPALNSNKRFWMEGRVALPVADSGSFFGLMELTGCTAEGVADNTLSIIDEDYLGFRVISSDTDGLDVEINQGAGTGPTVAKDIAHTVVDAAYVNLGITFDGKDTFTFFVNGVEVVTTTADSLDNNTFAHALGIFFIGKSGAAAANAWKVAWLRYAFEF